MFYPLQVLIPVKVLIGHRIVKDKPRTAHQVAGDGVIDGTVIFVIVVKPSSRINRSRVVEVHGVLNMFQQKVAAAEVGREGGHKNLIRFEAGEEGAKSRRYLNGLPSSRK